MGFQCVVVNVENSSLNVRIVEVFGQIEVVCCVGVNEGCPHWLLGKVFYIHCLPDLLANAA